MSVTIRTAGSGGQIHSFCAMNSLSMSFCIVPPSRLQATPCFSATADRKSTRLNSSHDQISYAVFCLKKKKNVLAIAHHTVAMGDAVINYVILVYHCPSSDESF